MSLNRLTCLFNGLLAVMIWLSLEELTVLLSSTSLFVGQTFRWNLRQGPLLSALSIWS